METYETWQTYRKIRTQSYGSKVFAMIARLPLEVLFILQNKGNRSYLYFLIHILSKKRAAIKITALSKV